MSHSNPSDNYMNEAEILEQALSLLQSGMALLDTTQANMAAAHLDASIVNIQSRLRTH